MKELDSVVRIDNEDYSITAKKVANKLTINTIKNGVIKKEAEFDGSKATDITIEVGDAESAKNAEKIQVNLDNNSKEYATITISTKEPTSGSIGDIWFKY